MMLYGEDVVKAALDQYRANADIMLFGSVFKIVHLYYENTFAHGIIGYAVLQQVRK